MKALDLFCGAGGMSLGLQQAGIYTVAAFDHWAKAVETYNANIPGGHAHVADLATEIERVVKVGRKHEVDVVCGGPPCQDFSTAGNRVEGERAGLTQTFAELCIAIQPEWVLMENVPRAHRSGAYHDARTMLTDHGYEITEEICNAFNHGVPQDRQRLIVIGRRNGLPDSVKWGIRKGRTALSMRRHFAEIGEPLEFNHYYRHPRSYARRSVFSVDELSPTIRGVDRPDPNNRHPRLTVRQRAIIQGFPPNHQWPSSHTAANQMIGNAVPVTLARDIGLTITGEVK